MINLKIWQIKKMCFGGGLLLFFIFVISNASAQEHPLKMESWRWNNQYTLKHIKIEGVVKNISNYTFRSVQIYIIAKDGNDKFLGHGDSWLEPMPLIPGETAIFSVYIDRAVCQTNKLKISCKYSPRLLK